MRKTITITAFLTTTLLVTTLLGDGVDNFVDLSFKNALKVAGKESKTVMVKFRADWCAMCRRMDQETLTDPEVARTVKDFIAIRIDTDSKSGFRLAQSLGVSALPTFVFLEASGKIIDKYVGFRTPELFLEILNRHKRKIAVSD